MQLVVFCGPLSPRRSLMAAKTWDSREGRADLGPPGFIEQPLDHLAYIYTIPVRVLEDECSQAVVLVLKALDDPRTITLANRVEDINVIDHQVGNIEIRSFVGRLQGQMQFSLVALQDHEADRIAVLKSLLEAENFGIKIMGLAHIPYGESSGYPSKTDTVTGDIVHRGASDCKVAALLQAVLADMVRFVVFNQQDGAYTLF